VGRRRMGDVGVEWRGGGEYKLGGSKIGIEEED
jgi:hypothetical protein